VLLQIVHDINGPLSTFSMEITSARLLLAKLDGDDTSDALTDLCENVDEALENAIAYANAIASVAAAVEDPPP